MTLGKKVLKLRAEHNLSQAKLAEQVYVSQQAINAIEHDVRLPGLGLASRLAKALGCTVDELLRNEV